MRQLVLASHNSGKIAEFETLLTPLGFRVVGSGALGLPSPAEGRAGEGATFASNASLKAEAALTAMIERARAGAAQGAGGLAEQVGLAGLAEKLGFSGIFGDAGTATTVTGQGPEIWALADDSGVCVDALEGAPGVDSAYFGGFSALLKALDGVPADMRSARFVCVLALARPGHETLLFTGVAEGVLLSEARGGDGFGYDPVFVPTGETRTFAQMTRAEKDAISHRGKAVRQLTMWLQNKQVQNTPAQAADLT